MSIQFNANYDSHTNLVTITPYVESEPAEDPDFLITEFPRTWFIENNQHENLNISNIALSKEMAVVLFATMLGMRDTARESMIFTKADKQVIAGLYDNNNEFFWSDEDTYLYHPTGDKIYPIGVGSYQYRWANGAVTMHETLLAAINADVPEGE